MTFNSSGTLDLNEVEEMIGYPVGGMCPFEFKNLIDVFIKDFDFAYQAADSRITMLKISLESIKGLTNVEFVMYVKSK